MLDILRLSKQKKKDTATGPDLSGTAYLLTHVKSSREKGKDRLLHLSCVLSRHIHSFFAINPSHRGISAIRARKSVRVLIYLDYPGLVRVLMCSCGIPVCHTRLLTIYTPCVIAGHADTRTHGKCGTYTLCQESW